MLLRTSSCLATLIAVCFFASSQGSDVICKKCKCEGTVINCDNLKMEIMFEYADWPNATINETRVTEATFEHNDLVHIKLIPSLPDLVRLSFCHNRIQMIEQSAFMYLQNMTELDLSHNELTSPMFSPHIFKGMYHAPNFLPLQALRILRLGSNNLHTLHSDVFEHVERIEVLTLDFNPLRVLDTATAQALASLQYLKVLDLSHTDLKELPKYLLHTPKELKELNLSGNSFTEVPEELMQTHNLTRLVLSENPIQVISDDSGFPSQLKTLKVLEMNWMPNLTKIEGRSLSQLQSLEEFHCSHNYRLTSISSNAFSMKIEGEDVEKWPMIKKLHIRSNKLVTLEHHLLARWDELVELDIEDNEWLCDCDTQWMVNTLTPIINDTKSNLLTNVYCEAPEQMKGRRMFDLSSRHYHMRCLDVDGNHPERDAKLLIGVLVGVLVAIPATLAAVLFWRRGIPWLSTGPAAYSRTFYSRADRSDDI